MRREVSEYHSRVTIWKDPVIEMQRTKNLGLLHKQLCKDSSFSRQGLCDYYLIIMRKWAEEIDSEHIRAVGLTDPQKRFTYYVGDEPPEVIQSDDPRYYSIGVWQRYASPVWFDIRQTNCLNIRQARDNSDEKHICPLRARCHRTGHAFVEQPRRRGLFSIRRSGVRGICCPANRP